MINSSDVFVNKGFTVGHLNYRDFGSMEKYLNHCKSYFKNMLRIVMKNILGTYQGQWLRGMRHGYGVRTSAAFGIASHSRGGDGRRPSISSLQPGMEETKVVMTNGTRGSGGEEARGGFVLKSRSDEAPVRRRSLVERTGMKNLMQVDLWSIYKKY